MKIKKMRRGRQLSKPKCRLLSDSTHIHSVLLPISGEKGEEIGKKINLCPVIHAASRACEHRVRSEISDCSSFPNWCENFTPLGLSRQNLREMKEHHEKRAMCIIPPSVFPLHSLQFCVAKVFLLWWPKKSRGKLCGRNRESARRETIRPIMQIPPCRKGPKRLVSLRTSKWALETEDSPW